MLLLLSLLLFEAPPALAAPDAAAGVSVMTGSVGQTASVGGRLGWESGLQLGLRAEGSRARGWYIDGRKVTAGLAFAPVVSVTLPLVREDSIRVDLEIDGGLRVLSASVVEGDQDRATVLLADVSPMVTLPAGDAFGVRLGFKQLTHLQLRPGLDIEAQGTLLRAAGVWIPSEDLQLGVEGQAGSAFGFDGDGGKAIVQGGVFARWVPGAARTYLNH